MGDETIAGQARCLHRHRLGSLSQGPHLEPGESVIDLGLVDLALGSAAAISARATPPHVDSFKDQFLRDAGTIREELFPLLPQRGNIGFGGEAEGGCSVGECPGEGCLHYLGWFGVGLDSVHPVLGTPREMVTGNELFFAALREARKAAGCGWDSIPGWCAALQTRLPRSQAAEGRRQSEAFPVAANDAKSGAGAESATAAPMASSSSKRRGAAVASVSATVSVARASR